MPTVPSLEAGSVQAEPLPGRPYPRVDDNVSAQDFGSGLAAGIEDVGTAGAQQQAKLKEQDDHLRVIDANTQLEAAKTQMLYGDGSGNNGAFSLHGRAAMNMPDTILPQYDQVAGAISQTLTPDQQRMFAGHISLGRGELNTQLSRYEYEEGNRLADEIFTNSARQTMQNAAVGWRDPQMSVKSKLDMQALVDIQGERQGWTSDIRQQKFTDLMGQLHEGVVQEMSAEGNLSGARAYLFKAMGSNEMEPKAADGMLRMINAQEEHQLAMADKQQRDASNSLLKNAIKMQQDGKLTAQWIEQHHATWEPQAYEYAYGLLSGKKDDDDPRVVAPLLLDAMSGKDVTQRAQDALYGGQIKMGTFEKIVEKSESPRKSYVTRGVDYINQSLQPNPTIPDPAGHRSLANALDDWRQWTEDNPQASDSQAREQYRLIADHYQVVPSGQSALFNSVPTQLVGSRMQPDVAATWSKTKEAYASGRMSEAEYQRQTTLLAQWMQSQQAQQAAAAKKKAANQ